MSGAWIKLRHDLLDAPEVRRLARATGLDRDQVYGKLFRLWSWADRHGLNGQIDAELEDVDEQVGQVGFGAALVSVGWLVAQDGGIEIPHWERHFSDSAKARGLAAKRMERARCATSATDPPDLVARAAQPDKRRLDSPPPPPGEAAPPDEAAATIRAAWAELVRSGHGKPYRASRMPDGWLDRLGEPGWLDEALRAIQHLPACRYFDSPATMVQLCKPRFVTQVLAGQYDDPKPAKGGPGVPLAAPVRVDPSFAAARAATERRERERQEAEHRRLDEAASGPTGPVAPRLKLVARGAV
jgi:hypothetical protein